METNEERIVMGQPNTTEAIGEKKMKLDNQRACVTLFYSHIVIILNSKFTQSLAGADKDISGRL